MHHPAPVRTLGGMKPRLPWTTHLVAPPAIVASVYLLWAAGDGFQWTGWEYVDVGGALSLVGTGLLVVALPATLAEVLLLSQLPWRWPARTVVVLFGGLAFLLSQFPAAFTLSGAPDPVDGELAVLGLGAFVVYVAVQALAAWWLVGLVPDQSDRPLDQRRLLVRLGLVEPPER
jgi:hypothetical protein